MLPKISIVTPSFNQGKYIEATIISVLEQGYPNLEYIIIDGGSSDETIDIIKKYESRISYWLSEPDKGQSDAINKGLKRVSGDVFNWLNSDDLLEKDALFEVGTAFAGEDILSLNGVCRTFNDVTPNETVGTTYTSFCNSVEKTIVKPSMGQPSQFYSMKAIAELGKSVNTTLSHSMDMELWYRFLFAFGTSKVKLTNKTLSSFRLHNESKSVSLKHIFKKDDYAIYLSIFNQFDAPDCIKNFILGNEINNNYKNIWTNDVVNTELLFAYFAFRFAKDYYIFQEYNNCRSCLFYAMNNGYPINSEFLALLCKASLPAPLINSIRKINNI